MTLLPGLVTSIAVDEQRLMDHIFKDYNNAARPVYNASQSVTVKFGVTLILISDMVSRVILIYLIGIILPSLGFVLFLLFSVLN